MTLFTCCSSPGWKVNCHRGQGGSPWGMLPGELLLKLRHLCLVSQRCPKLPWGMNAIRYLWDCWAIAGRTNRNPCLCPKGECLIALLWKKAAGACPKVLRFINILNLYDVSTLNIDRWWSKKKKKLYWDHYLIIAEATECDICHSYCISHGKTKVVYPTLTSLFLQWGTPLKQIFHRFHKSYNSFSQIHQIVHSLSICRTQKKKNITFPCIYNDKSFQTSKSFTKTP